MPDDDKLLRDAFDELRRAEKTRTPPFQRIWTSAQKRSGVRAPRGPLSFALAALSLIVVALLAAYRLRAPSHPPATAAPPLMTTAQWKSPTDFLLDTPGSDLGHSLPSFSSVPNYSLVTSQKGN